MKILVYLNIFALFIESQSDLANDPDVDKNAFQLIKSNGYQVEEYTVLTEDGYQLGIQRIPFGRSAQNRSGSRPVVLIVHSLISSSSEWVLNFPEQSLGYILSDSGYDVWLACLRGCTYSQSNVKIPKNTNEFWNFSWEENGILDMPAIVDFVLDKTAQEKLFLIGHSMGTTVSFVFLSLKPEYNQKIRAFMAMAPVANLTYTTAPIIRLALPFRDFLYKLFLATTHGEFTLGPAYDILTKLVCGSKLGSSVICSPLLFFGLGTESSKQFNEVSPPVFPLELISCPVALFWSVEDQFADPSDVSTLRVLIKNLVEDFKVPFSPWTHLDSAIAIQAKKYVYDKLQEVMSRY